MGSKYKFTPVAGPPPGAYNIDSGHSMGKKKSRAAHINRETHPERRPVDNNPGPGHHDAHLIPFGGSITHKMDFGDKYKFVPVAGPPPGAYKIDQHHMSKNSSHSALMVQPTSPYRRPKDNTPGPGHHDKHLIPFGGDITHKMDFGDKYEFKPVAGPAPGAYRLDHHNMSKNSSHSALMVKATSPYRRPKENNPGPGHHDSHLIPFGGDISHKMDFGDKYKPFVSETPSCNKYNPDDSFLSTNKRSPEAHIRMPTMMSYDEDLMPRQSPPK